MARTTQNQDWQKLWPLRRGQLFSLADLQGLRSHSRQARSLADTLAPAIVCLTPYFRQWTRLERKVSKLVAHVSLPCLMPCGDVAQLVEHRPGTPLTQVRIPGAARDFSPRVNFQCRLSYVCPYTHVYICAHVKDPVVHVRVRWIMETLKHPAGSRYSLWVRAPDSWSKGCELESRQEPRENFLPQNKLCVLTLIRCPFRPRVTAVARKRPRPFCQKCRWQVTHKHAYTPDPSKLEWADYTTVQAECGSLSGNELTRNSPGNTRLQSSQLAEPLWPDRGLKSVITLRKLISTLKKKSAGGEWIVEHSPEILAREEKATFTKKNQHAP